MNIDTPHVSENGSVVSIPAGYFPSRNSDIRINISVETQLFGRSYRDILTVLTNYRHAYNFKFTGFNDISIEELAATCNLSLEQAHAAKQREASEPLTWLDTEDAFAQFKLLLEEKGLVTTIKSAKKMVERLKPQVWDILEDVLFPD